jgi:hypothetical protein
MAEEPTRKYYPHLLLGRRIGRPDLLDVAAPHNSDVHWQHVALAAVALSEVVASVARQPTGADVGDGRTIHGW